MNKLEICCENCNKNLVYIDLEDDKDFEIKCDYCKHINKFSTKKRIDEELIFTVFANMENGSLDGHLLYLTKEQIKAVKDFMFNLVKDSNLTKKLKD